MNDRESDDLHRSGSLSARGRAGDQFELMADSAGDGCLYCGGPAMPRAHRAASEVVDVLWCDQHWRWALAARRERVGKQAGRLRRLLRARARRLGESVDWVDVWLGR